MRTYLKRAAYQQERGKLSEEVFLVYTNERYFGYGKGF
jgi:hypothetical protein